MDVACGERDEEVRKSWKTFFSNLEGGKSVWRWRGGTSKEFITLGVLGKVGG